MELIVHSIAELETIANYIISKTSQCTVFCLYGNLGAGKTTLTKLICQKLEVKDTISSPTYPIINEYNYPKGKIFHIDLYRLKNEDEAIQIGIEDYFYSNNICFVEWPNNFENLLPTKHIKIIITNLGEERKFEIIENG